jgi:hypothetical protein
MAKAAITQRDAIRVFVGFHSWTALTAHESTAIHEYDHESTNEGHPSPSRQMNNGCGHAPASHHSRIRDIHPWTASIAQAGTGTA